MIALAAELHKAKLGFTPNIFSEQAAIVALENHDRFVLHIEVVKHERERLYPLLLKIPGLYVYPSTANSVVEKGADTLVAGSAVFAQTDPAQAVRNILNSIL